jgi:hypothetical protein
MLFRKRIAILIIFCYSISLLGQPIQQAGDKTMHIVNVLDNIISADKGAGSDIRKGEIYIIADSDTLNIGKARVVIVKDSLSALEIIDLDKSHILQKGYLLVKASEMDSAAIDIMVQAKKQNFNKDQLTDTTNYYFEGLRYADKNYSGTAAAAGGLIAGFGLGLIGWGIGYLIVSNKSVEVPREYVSDLKVENQYKFTDGYTEKVKSKRNSSFNIGAAIGTVCAVIFVTSVYNK